MIEAQLDRMRAASKSLRARLVSLLALALVPAILLVGLTGLEQRQNAAEDVRAEAIRLAVEASNEQSRLIEQTQQLLVAVSQIPAVSSGDPQTCGELLEDIRSQYPFTANLGVIELDGSVVCSALPFDEPVQAFDRTYFQRALETGDFSAGDYQIGRITRLASINFGYPIRRDDGSISSVVFAALDLSWLDRVTATANLPPASTVTLFDQQGTVLVRTPESEAWEGTSASDSELFQSIVASGGEGTIESAGLDGVERLYGFTPLLDNPGQQAYVAVGIPATTAFAAVDRLQFTNLAGLVVITVLALGIAWLGGDRFVRRPIAALSRASTELGAGDLSARTGLPHENSELGQLAGSFDRMAESLERKQTERDEFKAALEASETQYRQLFTEMHSAFVLHEMVYTEDGERYDYRFLQVNPAFERLIGLPAESLEGQSARLVSPTFNEEWLQRYAQVVESGDPLRYEEYVEVLDKHVEVSAFRSQPDRFAAMMTDISGRKQAEARVHRQLQRLRALRAIDLAIASSLDPRVTFDVLLDQVTHQLEVDAASLLLYDRHTRTLIFEAGRGFRTDALRHTQLKLGEGHAGRAARNQELVAVADLRTDPGGFNNSALLGDEGFVSYYAAPLVGKGQVKGVLEVFHRGPLDPDREWVNFLEALAGQAAIAVDNSDLFKELRLSNQTLVEAYDTTLEGWAGALELRDDETEGHSERVTEVTVRLAREMGLPESDLVNIRRGAVLHDIGKIGIPDNVLLKPGPLTDEEWEVMRQHPVFAYRLLAPIRFLHEAIDIPYAHHERWDGSGYPRGLAGEGIPFAARIFAVVDVWDALRSDRPYRGAWGDDRVREYLEEQAGKLFDGEVVNAFLRIEEDLRRAKIG